MTDRSTITGGTVTGASMAANWNGHVDRLWNAVCLPLTGVGGTGNAVTATLDPVLLAALVTGMTFTIPWAATNSAGVTLSINGGATVAVLDATGSALTSGNLAAGLMSLLRYDGSALRVLTPLAGGILGVWARGLFDGTATPPTILRAQGVAGITRTATGKYEGTLSSAFASTSAIVNGNAGGASGAGANNVINCWMTSTTTFNIWCYDSSGAVFEDAPLISFTVQ